MLTIKVGPVAKNFKIYLDEEDITSKIHITKLEINPVEAGDVVSAVLHVTRVELDLGLEIENVGVLREVLEERVTCKSCGTDCAVVMVEHERGNSRRTYGGHSSEHSVMCPFSFTEIR